MHAGNLALGLFLAAKGQSYEGNERLWTFPEVKRRMAPDVGWKIRIEGGRGEC